MTRGAHETAMWLPGKQREYEADGSPPRTPSGEATSASKSLPCPLDKGYHCAGTDPKGQALTSRPARIYPEIGVKRRRAERRQAAGVWRGTFSLVRAEGN